MSSAPKVSFTIRRPSPVSRATSSGPDSDNLSFKIPSIPRHLTSDSIPGSPLARSANASPKLKSRTYEERDSSEEDEDSVHDELVTGFDRFGVQRLHENKPQAPLVIPSLKNKDWRELAQKRRTINRYVPASAKAEIGADGSVGGLGTRDTINSAPQLSGIQIKQRRAKVEIAGGVLKTEEQTEEVKTEEEETDDQRAIRALLSGTDSVADGPIVDVIPQPASEADAYRQDIDEFPDEATLEDYARIPVAQFGAALLRGMGWKEGAPVSKNKRGMVEPWIPTARPALLGIGARDQEVLDDGSKKNTGNKSKTDKRYVPVVKQERASSTNDYREASGSASDSHSKNYSSRRDSALTSRRNSRSPSLGQRSSRSEREDRYGRKERDGHRTHRHDRVRDRTTYRDGRRD